MAEEQSIASGNLGATSAVVSAQPCTLTGVYLETISTAGAIAQIYDNATTNSGTELARVALPVSATTDANICVYVPLPNIKAANGLYAELTTSTACIVYYK